MRVFNLFWCVLLVGLVSIVSAAPINSAFTYQGRLHDGGDPAQGLYDFSFRLMNAAEDGQQVGFINNREDVLVTGGYFVVSLNFGEEVFDCTSLWLEIAVVKNFKLPLKKTTLSPRQAITATPYAICAQSLCGTIDVSQITGLLGNGYTLLLPDIMYNRAILEMDGINTPEPVVVLVGPGVDIDRIEGFNSQGQPADNPGFAMEHPFVFETEGEAAVELKSYFNAYLSNPENTIIRNFSLIVQNLMREEAMRWNFASFAPKKFSASVDGRTRFELAVNPEPSRKLRWQMVSADFGGSGSYNPATDRLLEIDGITTIYSEVQVDTKNRTLSFTHSSEEGGGLYDWMKTVAEGLNYKRNMSVVELNENREEVGRDNYLECFPIRYEVLEGFGLDTTLRVRLILSYNRHQPG